MHIARVERGGLNFSRFIALYQSKCHLQTTILENIQNYEKLREGYPYTFRLVPIPKTLVLCSLLIFSSKRKVCIINLIQFLSFLYSIWLRSDLKGF
jgi:hypothetical protein